MAPTAGETVVADPLPYTIQWNSSDNIGIAEHDLYLSVDGGTNFAPIPECTDLSGTAQTCDWDPPNVNEFNAVIRVCATDVTAIPPAPNTTCATSGVFSIVYDITPPEAPTITSGPPEGSYRNQNSETFEFTAIDPPPNPSGINRYECNLDGGGFTTCSSPHTYNNLPDGAHTFRVRAVDNAGNIGPETVRHWKSDTTPPTLNVTAPNGGEFIAGNSSANIVWNASDATSGLDGSSGSATVEYSTDNGSTWNPAAGCENATSQDTSCTWNVPGVDTQNALVRVTVRDQAGNTTTDTSDAVFTIDSTPPDAVWTNGPCGGTPPSPCFSNSTSATFEFTGNDNFTPPESLTFECNLDDGGFTTCTSPQTYDGLQPGYHSFTVRAIDQAGNIGASSPPYPWTIDTDPPTVTVTFPNDDQDFVLVPGTNPINWTAADTGGSGLSYFDIELSEDDGSNWVVLASNVPAGTACITPPNCSYNWTITDPDKFNRTNRIRITVYDAAGNSSQDQSDSNFSYAFYERHESDDTADAPEFQHPTTALRRWWDFGFGGPSATYTCPGDPASANLFRWFPANDEIPFGPNNPQGNHSQKWFRWAVCQTGLNYFYPPAPDERVGLVAGPFPLTDAASAKVIMNLQWQLDPIPSSPDLPPDALYLLVSPKLSSETSACDTATVGWSIYQIATGTSPDFGAAFTTVQVDLSSLSPQPGDGPILGSTRCFGLLLLDNDGDGSEGLNYFGPMMDDFTVVKF